MGLNVYRFEGKCCWLNYGKDIKIEMLMLCGVYHSLDTTDFGNRINHSRSHRSCHHCIIFAAISLYFSNILGIKMCCFI